ncbi:hypothetical protein N7463_003675 [Penicillium fimorum]|uniref:Uncharacterized protein n=1 Tax=Penicillium fimorum TaxID=1882269 RepID=A0A9W9Y1T1_9EURO|nr:hypothetical protein N7463_003675 [Penicillium fimorum]
MPDAPSSLEVFSLVKGVNVSTSVDGSNKVIRPFKSVYYLGTPPDIEAKDLSSCVVVFHDSTSEQFNGSTVEGSNTGDEPVQLTEKATKSVKVAGGNSTTLEQELKKFSLDECDRFADAGGKLGNFSVKTPDGLVAVKNPTNCWPVQPKDYTINAMVEEAWKITPVLIFTGKGNSSLVDKTSSQLTCMKVVTRLEPPPDSGKNSAVAVKASGFAVGIAVLARIFAFL